MIDTTRTLALIGSAAGGVEHIRAELVEPALSRGWRVAVTLTPTAVSYTHLTLPTNREV